MSVKTGTMTIADLLANKQTTAASFDRVQLQEIIEAELRAHEMVVQGMLGELCLITDERLWLSGAADTGDMLEATEFTRGPTNKADRTSTLGFPLKLYQYGLGWTKKWFAQKSVADVAQQVVAAEKAHLRALQREIKRAIYGSANYTHTDNLVAPNVDLTVKRFLNADSDPIPVNAAGDAFTASSHTHYAGVATGGTPTSAEVKAAIRNVLEHDHGNNLVLAINLADEDAVRAMSDFTKYVDSRIVPATTSDVGRPSLDNSRVDNRAIGLFAGIAEVWVKPWAVSGIHFAYDKGDVRKPLAVRVRKGQGVGLQLAAELDTHPLVAQYMESEFGVAVATRSNGACLDTAHTSYTDPTITS
jgi:hypothetical protein